MSAVPEHLFDTRTIEKNRDQKRLTQEQIEAHLDALEDVAHLSVPTSTRMATVVSERRASESAED